MTSTPLILVLLAAAAGQADDGDSPKLKPEEPRFRVKVPDVVLTDVPVREIVLTAHNPDGSLDTDFNERVFVKGVTYLTRPPEQPDLVETALPPFKDGRLVLETDLPKQKRFYLTSSEILVYENAKQQKKPDGYLYVKRINRWVSLIPLILAVVLCIWLRNVLVALFAGLWSGAVLLTPSHGDFFQGLLQTLDTYILGEILEPDHALILLFTMFVGAMVGVVGRGGGSQALVTRLSRYTSTRERGQLTTWAMGLVIFFDDYANSLMVGSTMRPVTDRLKISREKLAFLVDATAAPIAGLALVSTWVGFEIGQIGDGLAGVGAENVDAFQTFMYSIPYRFYPLLLLAFVWLIAYTGHDYGPMLNAEARALSKDQLSRPGAAIPGPPHEDGAPHAKRLLMRNALVPIALLLVFVAIGLWWTGTAAVDAVNAERALAKQPLIETSLSSILSNADSNRVLFVSSFLASLVALSMVTFTRALKLNEAVDAWVEGAKSMFPALVILVMAWGIASVCDRMHLNTAGFLIELTPDLNVNWMPAITFIVAGLVAFATGSSFSTMGLLMPLSIAVTWNLLAVAEIGEAHPNHYLMLGTIGAVLAGAIFGDHCSPISDTTVLSSAASSCDHLDHVATQIPYAATVAGIALLFGYVPIGMGFKAPHLLLPVGIFALYLIVQFLGRPVTKFAASPPSEGQAGPADDEPVISLDQLGDDEEGPPISPEALGDL